MEGQSDRADSLYKDSSCVGSDIRNYHKAAGAWIPIICLCCKCQQLCRQAEYRGRQRSCFNTMREWVKPAETDKQKQERLRKWRREIGADTLLRLSLEEMRTCQCEHLASEITDECPPVQTERLAAESATERDIRLQKMSTRQCERLAAETIPERDDIARFYSEWETNWERDGRFECDRAGHGEQLFSRRCLFFSSIPSKPRCINPMQAWLRWSYASLVSRLPSWQMVYGRKGEEDIRLPVPVVMLRLLTFTLLQISR